MFIQGIIDKFYRNGNTANFSRMFAMAKSFKELLTPLEMEYLLVLDVSSTPVVLGAILDD